MEDTMSIATTATADEPGPSTPSKDLPTVGKLSVLPAQPFAAAGDGTDIVFVVGGEELHFSTAILSICSPVFKAKFTSRECNGKCVRSEELRGKKYDDVVAFFKQMHPLYCKLTPITDEILIQIVPLAMEYRAKSVLGACEAYIGSQLSENISPMRLTTYLLLCHRYKLRQNRAQVVELCVKTKSSQLLDTPCFQDLPRKLRLEIMVQRCERLEKFMQDEVQVTVDRLKGMKKNGRRCMGLKCSLCEVCLMKKVPDIIKSLEPIP